MDDLHRNAWLSFGALLTSLTTLVCCVLPAVLVTLGAGAVVVGLVSAVPQLVWLSEHKGAVFGIASVMLVISGVALYRGRNIPCPADPALGLACRRVRRFSAALFSISVVLVGVGAFVAFVLPVV